MSVRTLLRHVLRRPRQDEDPRARGRRAVADLRGSSAPAPGSLLAGSCDGRDVGVPDAGGGGGSDGGC